MSTQQRPPVRSDERLPAQASQELPPIADDDPRAVRYLDPAGVELKLNIPYIQGYFCEKATQWEAFAFMQFCRANQLNPFLREAYLVKYKDGDAAQMIVGYHVWLQRADRDPRYDGFRAGIVVDNGGELLYREGTIKRPGDELVGGWSEIRVKGRQPQRVEVSMEEYERKRWDSQKREMVPQALWATHGATMIQKVAIAQGFRFSFPRLYRGMYDESEIGTGDQLPQEPIIVEMPVRGEDRMRASQPAVTSREPTERDYDPSVAPVAEEPSATSAAIDPAEELFGSDATVEAQPATSEISPVSTTWDSFLDWLDGVERTVADVSEYIGGPVNAASIHQYMERNGLDLAGFADSLETHWGDGPPANGAPQMPFGDER